MLPKHVRCQLRYTGMNASGSATRDPAIVARTTDGLETNWRMWPTAIPMARGDEIHALASAYGAEVRLHSPAAERVVTGSDLRKENARRRSDRGRPGAIVCRSARDLVLRLAERCLCPSHHSDALHRIEDGVRFVLLEQVTRVSWIMVPCLGADARPIHRVLPVLSRGEPIMGW